MKAFDSDPSISWLFCLTHPDDEISIAAWIKRLSDSGARVGLSWTHDTAVREAEAMHFAEAAGVSGERCYFHHATDGDVCTEIGLLLPRFREMVADFAPDRLVCGAFEQGHIDHDATNYLVNSAKGSALVLEVPFYHTYLTRMPRINRFASSENQESIVLAGQEVSFKRRVARSYPSQRIWTNLIFAELRARLLGEGSLCTREFMRFQTWSDFRTPNLPPRLAERVQKSPTWLRWLACLPKD